MRPRFCTSSTLSVFSCHWKLSKMLYMISLCLSKKSNPTKIGIFAETSPTSVRPTLLSITASDMRIVANDLHLQPSNKNLFWQVFSSYFISINCCKHMLVSDLWLLFEHFYRDKHHSISQKLEVHLQPMVQSFLSKISLKSKICWTHHLFRQEATIAKDWIYFLLKRFLLHCLRIKS